MDQKISKKKKKTVDGVEKMVLSAGIRSDFRERIPEKTYFQSSVLNVKTKVGFHNDVP